MVTAITPTPAGEGKTTTSISLSMALPMEDINLHFTGDIHAISSAHNLVSAVLDDYIKYNKCDIDSTEVSWPRTMDMNDRALREIIVALGGKKNGYPRQDGFIITAASEIMAILCLAENLEDLKKKLSNIFCIVKRCD